MHTTKASHGRSENETANTSVVQRRILLCHVANAKERRATCQRSELQLHCNFRKASFSAISSCFFAFSSRRPSPSFAFCSAILPPAAWGLCGRQLSVAQAAHDHVLLVEVLHPRVQALRLVRRQPAPPRLAVHERRVLRARRREATWRCCAALVPAHRASILWSPAPLQRFLWTRDAASQRRRYGHPRYKPR